MALLLAAIPFAGCGGSDGSSDSQAVETRINRERAEAASNARQEQRLKDLEAEVKRQRAAGRRVTTVVQHAAAAAPEMSSGSPDQVFHAPSGNVTCRISDDGASCAVAAAAVTFVMPSGGGQSHIESGLALARGEGSLADWGTSVSSGAVVCSIPREDEPRGISCVNSATGHGFEASRVTARQKAY